MRIALVVVLAGICVASAALLISQSNGNDSSPSSHPATSGTPEGARAGKETAAETTEVSTKPFSDSAPRTQETDVAQAAPQLTGPDHTMFRFIAEYMELDLDSLLLTDLDKEKLEKIREKYAHVFKVYKREGLRVAHLAAPIQMEMRKKGEFQTEEIEKDKVSKNRKRPNRMTAAPKKFKPDHPGQFVLSNVTFDSSRGCLVRQIYRINAGTSEELDDAQRRRTEILNREFRELMDLISSPLGEGK